MAATGPKREDKLKSSSENQRWLHFTQERFKPPSVWKTGKEELFQRVIFSLLSRSLPFMLLRSYFLCALHLIYFCCMAGSHILCLCSRACFSSLGLMKDFCRNHIWHVSSLLFSSVFYSTFPSSMPIWFVHRV